MAVRRKVRNTSGRLPPIEYAPARLQEHGLADVHAWPLVSHGKVPGEEFHSTRDYPSLATAWTFEEIELNPANSWAALVLDMDGGDAELRLVDSIMSGKLPPPSWYVVRETSGGTHAVWTLKDPVHKGAEARDKPLLLFGRISEYFAQVTRADRGYNHQLTHNPVSDYWRPRTSWGERGGYTLASLRSCIPKGWRMPPRAELLTDAGRNCALFTVGLLYAGKHLDGDGGDVLDYLAAQNRGFKPEIGSVEVKGIARSVNKYRRRWNAQGGVTARYAYRQAGRVRRRWVKHHGATADRDRRIVEAQHTGRSLRSIAADVGMSLSGVRRVLSRVGA